MSKIIVEDKTEQVPVQDDNVRILEEEMFYTASIMGARLGMGTKEIALMLFYLAEDMMIYLKSMDIMSKNEEEKTRLTAFEYAHSKQTELEKNGTMDKIKQMVKNAQEFKVDKKA